MDQWRFLVLVGFVFVSCRRFIQASTVGSVSNGCARLTLGDRSNPNPTIPQATWYQTPTVVNMGNGHYRALGRVIHLKKLKQQLESQKQLNFHAVRSTMNVVQRVDILAEAVYVEGTVSLRGINSVKIYAREIVASTGSKIDFSAPNWNQFYRRGVSPGSNGENGKHGLGGPRVDISCDVITGSLEVISNGGNGHKGQRGGDGNNKADSGHTQPDVSSSICKNKPQSSCRTYAGKRGVRGQNGGKGGNAGNPGNIYETHIFSLI
ncbi:uncharacterized protein LOC144630023 [Oculina patagonica]